MRQIVLQLLRVRLPGASKWVGVGLVLAILFACRSVMAQPATQVQPESQPSAAGDTKASSSSPATEPVPGPAANGPPAKQAAPKELGEEWIRVKRDALGKPVAMQVAIVRYRGKSAGRPVEVDLIGAVHVGDADYYAGLNKRFRKYDALLYELVAPEGTVVRPEDNRSSGSVVGGVQNSMKSILELEHQLEKIDYQRPNFVHADMTPEEFFKSMDDRGEGLLQMYFRMVGHGIAAQSKQSADGASLDFDIFRALFAPDRARRLKIAMAEQMLGMESLLGGFGGEKGSTLITERNKAAFKVLSSELAKGKSRLGVFYGAGHLSDMNQRLRKEFKLLPDEITWVTAWDLTKK